MGKNYNYYDTPYNTPEARKYRGWETAILLIGIGVVSTLLMISHLYGNSQSTTDKTVNTEQSQSVSQQQRPCEPVNMIHVQQRDRLIQLIAIANDLPIEHVMVNEVGTVCYDRKNNPIYNIETDIVVTVGYTAAAKLSDYDTLGNHVASLLAPMMQIHPENPRDLVIHFLVGDSYLEWKHSYTMSAAYTQYMSGEALWFWAGPEF